jgi:glycosyl transferase family 25
MNNYYLLGTGLVLIIIIIIVIIYHNLKSELFSNNMKDIVTEHTYYINLEHRTDRKKDTLKELKSFGINNPTRFNAIKEDIGMIGCGKSHLEVLKIARKKNLPYVLIFEDDVKFLNPEKTIQSLNNVLNSGIDWNVILLGGGNFQPYTKINKDCVKVENCNTATAYLVKQSYYDTLINNWEDGLSKLIETKDEPKYALDQYWKILQKRDTFLLLTPLNVVQRESYSDIEKIFVMERSHMLDLK